MKLSTAIITLNLVGFLAVQVIEGWRNGAVSSVISLGGIWVGALLLVGAALVFRGDQDERQDQR